MQTLIDFIKGVIIGVANVIPGVSGGTLAISMGIYNELIDAVSNFLTMPLKSIKMVWKYAIGIVIGIIFSVFVVSYLFEIIPVMSSMLFIGLIIGTIPETMQKIDKISLKSKDILAMCIIFIAVMILGLCEGNITLSESSLSNNYFVLLGLGVIIAISIVVPGVSGSAILMALGCYTGLMKIVKDTLKHVMIFNIMQAFNSGKLLIFVGIGVAIGIFLSAKIIQNLMKKYPNAVNCGILVFMISTPLLVLLKLEYSKTTLARTIFSILMLIIGCTLAKKLSK